MGKCSEVHPMGRFWEIVFFHQILVMWEMYGFSHEFLIKWENATKLALRKEPGILIFPRFSRSMGKFSKTHLITNLSSGKLRANQEHLDHNIRKQFRSSRPEVFCRTRVLKNLHLCQSFFLNKVAGLGLQLYLKRDSGKGVFGNF